LVRWMASYTLSAWLPVFYRRVFGLSPATIATYLSLIYLFSGFGGSLIGSGIANFWAKVCIHVCSMWYGSDVNRLSLSLSLSLSFLLAHCVCVCTAQYVWTCLVVLDFGLARDSVHGRSILCAIVQHIAGVLGCGVLFCRNVEWTCSYNCVGMCAALIHCNCAH
jgi:hypothetical protein